MAFHCGNCGRTSTYKLADASCPDCYSIDALVEMPVPDSVDSRFNRTPKAPCTSVELRGPWPQSEHVEQAAIRDHPTANSISLPRTSRSASASNSRFGNTEAHPAAGDAHTESRRRLSIRDTVRSSDTGRASLAENRRSATGHLNAVAQVLAFVGERRDDVFSCIDACEEIAALDGYADHIHNAIKIVDSFRIRLQERRKNLANARSTSYDRANESRSALTKDDDLDQNAGLSCPIRYWKFCSHFLRTIVVKNLPKTVKKEEVVSWVEIFCKNRREVLNVILPKGRKAGRGKGFAYVTFARCEIVHEICRQKKYTMVTKLGTSAATEHHIIVEPFNEVEQHKKNQKYEIFVTGTFHHMCELDFVRAMAREHGKVKEMYYCCYNCGSPGAVKGCAMLTFEDPEVTKQVLEAGEIKVNGRTLCCKPWESRETHAARMNSERKGTVAGQEKNKKEQEDVDDDRLCCVCIDQPKCIMFRPCNHIRACEECAKNLDICPYCRQPSIDLEKVKAYL